MGKDFKMNNFEFFNPVRIVFGKGNIPNVGKYIPAGRKVMMIYGTGSIKKNGVYEQVVQGLKGFRWVEFSGIEPNPLYETCMKAVEKIKTEKVDFLLAVGGGSVLDATKFIAAACCYQGLDPWEILATGGACVKSALPLGDVLTLPATGSEMNANAVISRRSSQEKLGFYSPLVYPVFSILDPEATYSLPKKQLRNGLVDAFVHVMEQYATYSVNTPLQDRQAEAVVRTLLDVADDVLNKQDYDSRATFMWSATWALNGSLSRGVVEDWSTHGIGHELTAFFGVAHAESLAIVLPGVWKHQFENKKGKLAQLARRVWHITEGDETSQAQAAIEKTVQFFHSIGMPTQLSDFGISKADIQKVVERFRQRGTLMGEHNNIGAPQVEEILNLCL
jgi:NADP-dependent alcohol dehydrogenase